jgi:RecJ-like exonuclease
MKILSFKAWMKQNEELVNALKSTERDCQYCDGDGKHECDCGNLHDCRNCDGTGKEDGSDSADSRLRDVYDKKRITELAGLASWGNVVMLEELSNPIPQGYIGEPNKPSRGDIP